MAAPVSMEELAPRFVDTFVRVCTKIIALSLQQIGRQTFRAVTVEICQGRTYCRYGDTQVHRHSNHTAPGRLRFLDGFGKERIDQQINQLGVAVERFLDLPRKADRMIHPPRHINATPP